MISSQKRCVESMMISTRLLIAIGVISFYLMSVVARLICDTAGAVEVKAMMRMMSFEQADIKVPVFISH